MKKYLLLLGIAYLGSAIAAEPVKANTTQADPALTQPSKKAKAKTPAAASDPSKSEKKADKTAATDKDTKVFDAMIVTGEVVRDSHYASPSSRVTRKNIERQNAQTTEEALKYQPSLNIRQRYIGDPNGLLSIRGSGLFATGRNMVFADGLPLHNLLQSQWNSAPRWSMVGPNEIDAVDVIYGPYSAEYSGNSMGGVVNIKGYVTVKYGTLI